MANASIEISGVSPVGSIGEQLVGSCVRQETLAISGSTATIATAVTTAEANGAQTIARIVTDDTGCYMARGTTPDPTATAQTSATTARRWIPAGGELVVPISVGEKIAVHS